MLSKKSFGIAGAAMLGSIALLGTNAANAAIDVDAGTGAVKYAKETLLNTEVYPPTDGENAAYCVVDSGTDNVIDVVFRMDQFPSTGETVYLRYDLTNMVFVANVASANLVGSDGSTAIPGTTVTVNQGGAAGGSSVILGVTATDGSAPGANTQVHLNFDSLGVMADAAGSIKVASYDTLPDAIAEENAFKSVMADDVVMVVNGIMETPTPANPPATAEVIRDFTTFADVQGLEDTSGNPLGSNGVISQARIGRFVIGLSGTDLRAQDGTAVTGVFGTGDGDLAAVGVAGPPATGTMATFTGDFSVISAHLDNNMNCTTDSGAGTGYLAVSAAAIPVIATTFADTGADATTYLCAMVDDDNEDMIAAGAYTVNVAYGKVADTRKFTPMGMMDNVVGEIIHNGMTVHIPFLTTSTRHNQRIVIYNRGDDTTYSMTFTPETGMMADGGGAHMGDLPSGTTTLVLNPERAMQNGQDPVVNITGGSRTAATFTAAASPENVDISVVTINLEDRSIDTVQYFDQSMHRPHITLH